MRGFKHRHDMILGAIFPTTFCGDIEILDYRSANEIIVKFINTGHIGSTTSQRIRVGHVKDPYHPYIVGLGYKGVGKFGAKSHQHIYTRWWIMFHRIYISDNSNDKASYSECSIDPRWYNFQNFAEWFCSQPNHDLPEYEIDKDLKVEGNRVYGPETCLLIPKSLNVLMASDRKSNALSPGVKLQSGKYVARATIDGVRTVFGPYDTLEEAARAYRAARKKAILTLASRLYLEYKINSDILELIRNRYS